MNNSLLPFLWFLAILALIPIALWLLKRTPMGGAAAGGMMRVVATLPVSPSQRIQIVEIGQGDERQWLVLGITGQQITTLHVMPPQAEAPGAAQHATFAQMLSTKLRGESRAQP